MLTDSVPLRRLLFALVAVVLGGIMLAGATDAAAPPSGGVTGTLRYKPSGDPTADQVPVAGVDVVAYRAELSPDGRSIVAVGTEAGRSTSGADGTFRIDLATPGDYAIEIDISTLPDGIELKNAGRAQLPSRLNRGQVRTLLFALTEGDGGAAPAGSGPAETTVTVPSARRSSSSSGGSTLDRVLRLSYKGLQFGLIIGMCSIGLSLIFATTGLVNFAHGELITLGGVLAFFFNSTLGLHLFIAAPIAVVVGGLLGAGIDAGLWRPLRNRGVGLVSMMVISIGFSIALRYSILYFFGDRSRPYKQFAVQTVEIFAIGPIRVLPKDLFIMVTSTILLVGVALLLKLTKLGKAMRAIADNSDLASATGINVGRTITVVWFLAGALVTVGGIFLGLTELNQWEMGTTLLLLVFAAVTLGGLGTTYGVMVGSLIIGIVISVATVPKIGDLEIVEPASKSAGALLVMIILLMFRPQGLFGRRERIG